MPIESVSVDGPVMIKLLKSRRIWKKNLEHLVECKPLNYENWIISHTWQISSEHGQILLLHAPDPKLEESKYVQFSLVVAPHPIVTVN